ncbi:MAG: glycosyltransferase [Flavobacteriales bacterium]|nr:glycosyltransferase [Flavobacteriales bacterium]
MSSIRVSLIVCTYNREQYIGRAIDNVANQNADKNSYELVLVNNQSTDSTDVICQEKIAAFPGLKVQYIIETSQGLSYARNRGFKESKGDILVYLDDDAFAAPDFVSSILSFYDSHPQIVASGGKTIPVFEAGKPAWMSHFLMPLVAAMDLGEQAQPFQLRQYPIGANMAVRKSILEKVGAFDVNLGRKGKNLQGGEEKDLFNRIREAGFQPWYLPTTVVEHIIPESRMKVDYIRRQARGIGFSERVRTKSLGWHAFLFKAMAEKLKWIATLFLFLGYFFTLQPLKAVFLIRFRWWVSQGLFFAKE